MGTVAVTADMTDLAGLVLRTGHVSSVDANAYRDALGLGRCRPVLLESRSRAADQRIPARIRQAKRILDESLAQDRLTIEAAAERVGFTPQHLNSAFWPGERHDAGPVSADRPGRAGAAAAGSHPPCP